MVCHLLDSMHSSTAVCANDMVLAVFQGATWFKEGKVPCNRIEARDGSFAAPRLIIDLVGRAEGREPIANVSVSVSSCTTTTRGRAYCTGGKGPSQMSTALTKVRRYTVRFRSCSNFASLHNPTRGTFLTPDCFYVRDTGLGATLFSGLCSVCLLFYLYYVYIRRVPSCSAIVFALCLLHCLCLSLSSRPTVPLDSVQQESHSAT